MEFSMCNICKLHLILLVRIMSFLGEFLELSVTELHDMVQDFSSLYV